jgi:putative membrane protein
MLTVEEDDTMMMGGGILVTFFFLLLFFLLIIGVAGVGIWLYRQNAGSSGGGMGPRPRLPENGPLDILKRRYASGEITREEYEQMKSDLSQ